MGSLQRRALLGFVTLFTSAVLGLPQAVQAQGPPPPPGLLPAGEYTSTSSFAQFHARTASGINVQAFVVDRSALNRPKDAPSTGGRETQLSLQAFGFDPAAGFFFFDTGCYKIPASAWSVAADLSTATVNATVDSSMSCGPMQGFPPTFVVSLTWTGIGPVASNHGVNTLECLSYLQVAQRTNSDNLAMVSGTIAALPDPIAAVHGTLSMGTISTHVEGVVDPTCPPGIGGKGAGAGPPPAGNYVFKSVQDGAGFESADFKRRIFVSFSDSMEVAKPQGGTAATTERTQLFISINDFSSFPPTFENGCFLVSPGVVTQNGVQSASLHVKLVDDPTVNPPCSNNPFQPPNNIPLPLTVDVSWNAAGPAASATNTNQSSCATYTTELTSLFIGAVASDTFTLTPLFSDTFSSPNQGGLTTSETTLHAQGVDPQACIVRG